MSVLYYIERGKFMDWKVKCIPALTAHHVFLSPQHFDRFEQLYALLEGSHLFTKGLCKCAFLAAWDHDLTIKFRNTVLPLLRSGKIEQNRLIAKAKEDLYSRDPNMKVIYQMVMDFLQYPDQTPSEACMLSLSPNWLPVADSALEASHIIDRL